VIFTAAPIPGVFVVQIEPLPDARGFFARAWCREEFAAVGLEADLAQCNISFAQRAGTVRGMHYQADPHGEAKLVRCTSGSVHDVLIDLRRHSPTFRASFHYHLQAESRSALYIPIGVAHGFQTLEDDTEMFYQMSTPYVAEAARGVRWDDPGFDVSWPLPISVISERDLGYPDFPV
jgi:dTDP-4-dehydrorhamnose 3,5-epimerase